MSSTGEQRRSILALRRFLIGRNSLEDALTELAAIATETVTDTDLASISVLRDDGTPATPAFTSKTALDLDLVQYDAGDGPCLAAMRHRGVEHVTVGAEMRWPHFERAASESGVRSTLSVALIADDDPVGGLNLYSTTSSYYGEEAREAAQALACEIAVAVANVVTYDKTSTLVAQLEEALSSRATIDQAKGIVMAANRCSAEDAFEILRRASQRENRKLREIAADIVERAQQRR